MSPTPWDLPPRIAAKIAVDAETDCWAWTGARMQQGYGRLKLNGRMGLAYRVVYELLCAKIPEGHEIDHLCRHPHCVNPRHVEPVTRTVNRRRQADAALATPIYPCGHPRTLDNSQTVRRASKPTPDRVCRTCHRAARDHYNARRVEDRRATTREQAAA